MALGRKIVNLVGADLVDDLDDGHGIAHVGIVEVEMGRALEVGDPFAEIDAAAADDAVDLISFLQQELGQVGAVLARDAGDEC